MYTPLSFTNVLSVYFPYIFKRKTNEKRHTNVLSRYRTFVEKKFFVISLRTITNFKITEFFENKHFPKKIAAYVA